jgi:hypothetical protein
MAYNQRFLVGMKLAAKGAHKVWLEIINQF